MSCSPSIASGKQVVSIDTTEEIKEVPTENGAVSKITSIVTKTTYSDGSTSTKTQTRTLTESSLTSSNFTRSIQSSASGTFSKESSLSGFMSKDISLGGFLSKDISLPGFFSENQKIGLFSKETSLGGFLEEGPSFIEALPNETSSNKNLSKEAAKSEKMPNETSGTLPKEKQESSSSSISGTNREVPVKNPNEGFTQFQIQCLNAHNEYRQRHGVPPLKLSQKLCKFSQSWADNLSRMNRMQHSQGSGYGENIYWYGGNTSNGKDPVDLWYNEIKQYNFSNQGFSLNTGHFTQVVWKDSTELGVGRSASGRVTYVVSNYNPPGNYQGKFRANVFPRK